MNFFFNMCGLYEIMQYSPKAILCHGRRIHTSRKCKNFQFGLTVIYYAIFIKMNGAFYSVFHQKLIRLMLISFSVVCYLTINKHPKMKLTAIVSIFDENCIIYYSQLFGVRRAFIIYVNNLLVEYEIDLNDFEFH